MKERFGAINLRSARGRRDTFIYGLTRADLAQTSPTMP